MSDWIRSRSEKTQSPDPVWRQQDLLLPTLAYRIPLGYWIDQLYQGKKPKSPAILGFESGLILTQVRL